MISPEDYALKVLFSNTLEEKLSLSGFRHVSFDNPSREEPLIGSPTPGRPGNLLLPQGKNHDQPHFPTEPQLVDEENRGILLHFFANHELLAAELMALALLKFPDAPTAFRKGLLNTLREEQIHTQWYLNRMKECGVSFGDYRVSRFFWDTVSGMDSPLDYVSRLSLTFEQANLDYSKYYAGVLKEAGDASSAAILEKIYKDEIAHVGYGLKWFRKWKSENGSDWGDYRDKLVFPLSPVRAKGNKTPFNREGRIAAGFDDEFIEQLSLYERSRGRTPNVYYFNADAEERIGVRTPWFHPNKFTASLLVDLEWLIAFAARLDDVVLLRKNPPADFLKKIASAGFVRPETELIDEQGLLGKDSLLRERKVNEIRPWARSPELPALFNNFRENINSHLESFQWTESTRATFSKASQIALLSDWCGESLVAQNLQEFDDALRQLREAGHRIALLKRPLSTAGKGHQQVHLENTPPGPVRKAVESILESQGAIVIEPFHDRVLDFSMQYQMKVGELRLLGPIHQIVDHAGRYRGSESRVKFCRGLDPELCRFLMEQALPTYHAQGAFFAALEAWAGEMTYYGPLGVDAYLYRDSTGKLKHRTFCEINPRYTMGRITLEIRKQIAPGRNLHFEIIKAETVKPSDDDFQLNGKGQIENGTMIVTPVTTTSRFAAKITVAK